MKAFLIVLLLASSAFAQTPDPSTLPLVQKADLQYIGGFRVPPDTIGITDLSYGGNPIAINPATGTLFVGTLGHLVAELSIPSGLVNSTSALAMPMATFVQPMFVDPAEGNMKTLSTSSTLLGGMLVRGDKLFVSAAVYYDGMGDARVSHFSHSTTLPTSSFSGWSAVWHSERSGFVGGYMGEIPAEHQARLGGTAITGQCCLPIITRTSFGPSAFAFDPTKIGQALVPATPLLYYDDLHTTLGTWIADPNATGPNIYFNQTASVTGVVLPPGTRSALYFGTIGVGVPCYGYGVTDKAMHGTFAADGQRNCYDPTGESKGTHAYPYRYQVWAYDLNDFAAVKEGRKQPWEVRPYDVWPLELPTVSNVVSTGGATFDTKTNTIYLSQWGGQVLGCCLALPVIHGFKVAIGTTPIDPPPPPPPPVDPKVLELEARIAAIKGLIQQALKDAPRNTATRVTTPLKSALTK